MSWCGPCQENFDIEHFDDNDEHFVGIEYGPTGYELACVGALVRIADRVDGDDSPLAAEVRTLIGDDLRARLRRPLTP